MSEAGSDASEQMSCDFFVVVRSGMCRDVFWQGSGLSCLCAVARDLWEGGILGLAALRH